MLWTAEVAFDGVPGRVFKGKVQPGPRCHRLRRNSGWRHAEGSWRESAVATIDLDEDISSYNLPGGSAAQVALYTSHTHEFALLRKILLRMKSWQNFVFTEGHGDPAPAKTDGH
jgi:hypothetical protein